MKITFTILVFLLIVIGVNCNRETDARINQKELEIYKTLLGDKPKEIVVIHSETNFEVFGITKNTFKEILKQVRSDTFDDFVKVNSVSPKIKEGIKNNFNYPLVNQSDFKNDNLEPIRYYTFSRVGFSNDGKQAVVMFVDVCNALCSEGAYYLLQNNGENWEIVQKSESWKS